MKTFTYPTNDKRRRFKATYEAKIKDVELDFNVLKSCWVIVALPA